MSPSPVIETARLVLRRHRPDDLDARTAITSDPETMRFIGGVQDREESWARILRYAGNWALLGRGPFAVEDRTTGRLIGTVGIADFARGLGEDFDGEPEALWMLAADTHGRGLATEAMRAALAWHDGAFGPKRIVCIVSPDNAASLALATNLGFTAFGERTYHDRPVRLFERIPFRSEEPV